MTGCLGVKKYISRTKDPLYSSKTERNWRGSTDCTATLWLGGTLRERPVPSTSAITPVGNTNLFSAHGHVWVVLDIFCDTSWTEFCQKSKFENTSEREKPLLQTITTCLNCLVFVHWLCDFEPATLLLRSTEAPYQQGRKRQVLK